MDILIIEPYFTGSHAAWARGIQQHSRHSVSLLTMPGRFWKWRMHGASVTLARNFLKGDYTPDLVIATDMLDLAGFLGLARQKMNGVPVAIYFHENQLTYPWSPDDRDLKKNRDRHYCFINFQSALAADHVFFNSSYHMESFLGAIPGFLNAFPDYRELGRVEDIRAKSRVLPLGMDLARFDEVSQVGDHEQDDTPLLLWNHRWEYDKNPDDFFDAMYRLEDRGLEYSLALLGEHFVSEPKSFRKAKKKLKHRIQQFGYADSFEDYARWLWRSRMLPVTSNQDFFGISIMEAMYCGCVPILPRRLTYPELVPEDRFPEVFYDSQEELVEKLERFMREGVPYNANDFRTIAAQYNWGRMIHHYDGLFEQMLLT